MIHKKHIYIFIKSMDIKELANYFIGPNLAYNILIFLGGT